MTQPLSTDVHRNGRHAVDPDQAFRQFFEAERPKRWPAAPRTTQLPRDTFAGLGLWQSRFALAASLALLVAGPWMLGSAFRSPTVPGPSGTLESATRLRFKTNLRFEQPKDGPTEIRIDVIEESPRSR